MRSAKLNGSDVKVGRVETDYSFALIQASLKTFNNMNVKTYIKMCYELVSAKATKPPDFTIIHLCAAHMWKDFSRQLAKYKNNIRREVRLQIYKGFALLQNTTTIQQARSLFSDMCFVFYAKHANDLTTRALDRLRDKVADVNRDDCDSDEDVTDDYFEKSMVNFGKTIKDSSPFTNVFDNIAKQVLCETSEKSDGPINAMYCPEFIQCLLGRFMYLFPLWSGIMLNVMNECISRDTNADVESWFKIIKSNLCIGRNRRPAKFVVNLKQLVNSRITEHDFPGARKKKTAKRGKKRKLDTDVTIDLEEEKWSRKRKRNKKSQISA